MEDNDGKRLKQWRKNSNISQKELGSLLGRSQSYIGDIESGRAGLSRDLLARLLEKTNVNAGFLLTGVGNMDMEEFERGFVAGGNADHIDPPNYARPLSGDFASGNEEFNLIHRFDIGLSGGARLIPVENAEADHIAVTRSWLRKHNLTADLCVLVKVSGDSMSPTIPDDSLVLVDISDMRSTREGIYAFRRGGEAFIKRLVPVGVTEDDKPGALVIVSDNPSIAPETISGEGLADIRIVGRVKCVIANL